MSTQKIYCIKISQKYITDPQFDYWPYDRSYLIHKDNFHIAPFMFRYYFYMQLTPEMLRALNNIEVKAHREITTIRNDSKFEYVRGSSTGQFNWIENATEWFLMVPTHVTGMYRDKKAVASLLAYISTRAIKQEHHNKKVELPQISLKTPTRDIKFFCATCTNITNFYEGDCKAGTSSCKLHVDAELPFDENFRLALKRSAIEAGGV